MSSLFKFNGTFIYKRALVDYNTIHWQDQQATQNPDQLTQESHPQEGREITRGHFSMAEHKMSDLKVFGIERLITQSQKPGGGK